MNDSENIRLNSREYNLFCNSSFIFRELSPINIFFLNRICKEVAGNYTLWPFKCILEYSFFDNKILCSCIEKIRIGV